uniref:Na(+)/H(+) exchange regulatory cofactor NHE-RF n=1 Tax=Leptobrachium leishanense TaxID=445787 RepID=A0A8C5R4X7_9ANUR
MGWSADSPAAFYWTRTCVLEKGPSGYGFHLHSEKGRQGQFIRLVEPASPAEKSGLQTGDRIISVSGEDVSSLSHQQVVAKIREATSRLVLVVERPAEDFLSYAGISVLTPPPLDGSQNSRAGFSIVQKELRPRLCSMKKGPNGYGFNLHSDKTQAGQFIRAVDPDSPAELSGLQPKDRIIEVNGVSMIDKQHTDVVNTIKSGGDETTLLVVDPETDLFFKECAVSPGREHLTGPLPEKVANGSLEQVTIFLCCIVIEHSPFFLPKEPQDTSPVHSTEIVTSAVPPVDPLLDLNMSLAVAKERAHQKRSQKKAPTMDWNKRKEVFSSL